MILWYLMFMSGKFLWFFPTASTCNISFLDEPINYRDTKAKLLKLCSYMRTSAMIVYFSFVGSKSEAPLNNFVTVSHLCIWWKPRPVFTISVSMNRRLAYSIPDLTTILAYSSQSDCVMGPLIYFFSVSESTDALVTLTSSCNVSKYSLHLRSLAFFFLIFLLETKLHSLGCHVFDELSSALMILPIQILTTCKKLPHCQAWYHNIISHGHSSTLSPFFFNLIPANTPVQCDFVVNLQNQTFIFKYIPESIFREGLHSNFIFFSLQTFLHVARWLHPAFQKNPSPLFQLQRML